MQFTKQAIDRFIAIYEQEFREPISREDAEAMARRLINLYRLFLRPLPRETIEEAEMPAGSDSSGPQAA